jgi:hypothetical protein
VKSTAEVGMFYSEFVEDFCCGLIMGGSKNCICCKAFDKCKTNSHTLNKAKIRNRFLYIEGTKANQILIEPALDGFRLSKVTSNNLINDKRFSSLLITYFEDANSKDNEW